MHKLAEQPLAFEVLRQLEREPQQNQRQLASTVGVSVGKLNYVMRALLKVGLVKMENFRTSENRLAYLYLLTPAGVAAKADLARYFLRRKSAEYEALEAEISLLRAEITRAPSAATKVT